MMLYRYVGPQRIAEDAPTEPAGVPIRTAADVIDWIGKNNQRLDAERGVTATFVVDEGGVLRIADRHSEHVRCAGRRPVLSAGEITFEVRGGSVAVASVSNQSTGYCPEPESWPAVAAALSAAGFTPPDGFALACVFRLCPKCGHKNLVKEGVFECGLCGADLPAEYNCQTPITFLPQTKESFRNSH